MSEEAAETTTENVEQSQEAVEAQSPDTGVNLEEQLEKWRSMARKHEARAKENAEKASKYDEVVESQKTEQQKLADKLAEAEKRAAALESEKIRVEVAAEKGVPADMISGSTREELEAYADRLLEFRTKSARPDFGGGARGTDFDPDGAQITSQSQLDGMTPDEIVEARKSGRLDDLLGVKR